MAKEQPFNDEEMSLIVGLGGPREPGQHGRSKIPAPGPDAVEFATQIRDLCEDFLRQVDKEPAEKEMPEEEPSEEEPEEKEE